MSDILKVYMDNGAGKPVDPRVLDEMNLYQTEFYGNPASFHTKGFEALTALNTARKRVAALINADPKEITFTSGATEANNLALIGGVSPRCSRGRGSRLSFAPWMNTASSS